MEERKNNYLESKIVNMDFDVKKSFEKLAKQLRTSKKEEMLLQKRVFIQSINIPIESILPEISGKPIVRLLSGRSI